MIAPPSPEPVVYRVTLSKRTHNDSAAVPLFRAFIRLLRKTRYSIQTRDIQINMLKKDARGLGFLI